MNSILTLAWPAARLGEAIHVLASNAGMTSRSKNQSVLSNPESHIDLSNKNELGQWLNWATSKLQIEMEPVKTNGAQFNHFLRCAAPVLIRYCHQGNPVFLLLLNANRRHAVLISPQLKRIKCTLPSLRALLWSDFTQTSLMQIQSLIEQTDIPQRQWSRVKNVLLNRRINLQYFDDCWLLRVPPSTSFPSQLAHAGIPRRLFAMLATFSCVYILELIGWALIGWGALAGRFDPGWLLAWALLLLSMVPFHLWGSWLQGSVSVQVGTLLKKRLLAGALAMDMDSVRRQGVGQLLGRVIESQAIDSLVLSGGFTALVAIIELVLASAILIIGAGGLAHAFLLWGWLLVATFIAKYYYVQLRRWTQTRIKLSHDLIERMVGHRTRLAQEPSANRHQDEDLLIDEFLQQSKVFDRSSIPLIGGLPRGWLLIGLAGLAPNFIFGSADVLGLIIGLGGVLLAYRALSSVASGVAGLARAMVAWEQIHELFHAAAQQENTSILQPDTRAVITDAQDKTAPALLQANQLAFTHARQQLPVLSQFDLSIYPGDRVLLEGPSGCGKSTLAALLVGLRQADSGLLLLKGLDRATWGSEWRHMTTAAPQFHENHVLSGTLAFNLLMGRNWPPSEDDMAEAKQLCMELGLGELIDRMPGGLRQMVGETGWQLSHGERSRMYLARALLQKSDFVVLDESFAALDPGTLKQCLTTAMVWAPTLLVIAHR